MQIPLNVISTTLATSSVLLVPFLFLPTLQHGVNVVIHKNILGLTVPWIASASFPELRLTLANSSFLFNMMCTVINVCFIEHRFALLIDGDVAHIHSFVSSIIAARLLAFIVVGPGLWVILC